MNKQTVYVPVCGELPTSEGKYYIKITHKNDLPQDAITMDCATYFKKRGWGVTKEWKVTEYLQPRQAVILDDGEWEDLKNKISNSRDSLYNSLPSGEIHAFDLIKIIKAHLSELDELLSQLK